MSDMLSQSHPPGTPEEPKPLVLQTPLAIPVKKERVVAALTRVLSWASVVLFLVAVLVALIGAAEERDQLRDQIDVRSVEMICRASADDELTIAQAETNALISQALVAVAVGDDEELQRLARKLDAQNKIVADEVEEFKEALILCDSE